MTMTMTTRRAILAGMPAVAVAGVHTNAFACADTELLAIGRELEPLLAEYWAARRLDAAESAEIKRRIEARIGRDDDSQEYLDARHRVWAEVWAEMYGPDSPDIDDDGYHGHRGWSAINGELWALTERALALRATTREGFAVQVLAWTVDYCEIVEEHPAFFTAVCAYAGVPMPERLDG